MPAKVRPPAATPEDSAKSGAAARAAFLSPQLPSPVDALRAYREQASVNQHGWVERQVELLMKMPIKDRLELLFFMALAAGNETTYLRAMVEAMTTPGRH